MGNDLTTIQTPGYLAALSAKASDLNAFATAGVSAGGHNRVSIKSSRFRLSDTQGEEQIVPEHFLDVIILDANPNLSKVYYANAYDPTATEPAAPTCHSDNGIAPSSQAATPQATGCAACPHNVWGSKVNTNGSKTKACQDSRKLAVVLASNASGAVYELRVPAASLKNLVNYVNALSNKKVNLASVVTRLEFDPQADYPKLLFKPQGWITQDQAGEIVNFIGSEELDQCTGKKDKPYAATSTPPQAANPIPNLSPTGPTLNAAEPAKRTRKPKLQEAPPVAAPANPFAGFNTTTPATQDIKTAIPLSVPIADDDLESIISAALKI